MEADPAPNTCATCKYLLISEPPHTRLTCLNDKLYQRYIPDLKGSPITFTPPAEDFGCNRWEAKPTE